MFSLNKLAKSVKLVVPKKLSFSSGKSKEMQRKAIERKYGDVTRPFYDIFDYSSESPPWDSRDYFESDLLSYSLKCNEISEFSVLCKIMDNQVKMQKDIDLLSSELRELKQRNW